MIYSVPDVIGGGFAIFEAPSTVPINNDHPTPMFDKSLRTKVGIPSILASRPLPVGAQPRGRANVPSGHISSGIQGSWGSSARALPSGLGAWEDEGTGRLLVGLFGVGALAAAVYAYSSSRDRYDETSPARKVAAVVFSVAGLAALGNATGVLRHA